MTHYEAVEIDAGKLLETIVQNLPFCSYEELEDTMRAAREEGEASIIRRVAEEATYRSVLDGTNSDYNALALKCLEAIDLLEPKEQ